MDTRAQGVLTGALRLSTCPVAGRLALSETGPDEFIARLTPDAAARVEDIITGALDEVAVFGRSQLWTGPR